MNVVEIRSPFAVMVGDRRGRAVAYVNDSKVRVEFADGGLEDLELSAVKSTSFFATGQQEGGIPGAITR